MMENRRSFIKKSSLSLLALSLPFAGKFHGTSYGSQKIKPPIKALVVWYSQTGNTERAGRLIAKTFERQGLITTASDYRDIDTSEIANFDLIVAGSPVYYYDVPENFKQWLRTIPGLKGKTAASYVTYGGEGGNQHNTACTLLELLADKGALPIGISMFGNMSTFAITWSTGNVKRILKYKHLPDKTTYGAISAYAVLVTERAETGVSIDIDKEFDFHELIKNTPAIWGTKLLISKHTIDKDKCIGCGICTSKCPVNAINLSTGDINKNLCIACLGCVNNCPEKAVDMEFLRKKVYGFNEFIKRNNIQILQPEEFKEHT